MMGTIQHLLIESLRKYEVTIIYDFQTPEGFISLV